MAVKLLVDSASDVSREEAKNMGITVLPLLVTIDEKDYLDGVDLLPSEFYEKLIESDSLPKTSQITPFRFEEEYKKLTANGDEVVVITLSSKLSGTYGAAVQASANFKEKVFVVDSLNVAVGERLLIEYAMRLIAKGKSASVIASELNVVKNKIKLMAVLGTLEYLKKGGRISAAVAFAGGLLSLKPVVAVEGGEVKLIGKALGSKKGNNLLNKLVEQSGGIDFTMPFGTVWSGLDDSMLKKYVTDSDHLWQGKADNIPQYIIGATIGTHVGPGVVGVAFFANKN